MKTKSIIPTLTHMRAALKVARDGGKKYKFFSKFIEYFQGTWCGTECCVWGHALLLAGNEGMVKDTLDQERLAWRIKGTFMQKSKRHMALGVIMEATATEVLPILGALLGKGSVQEILEKAKENCPTGEYSLYNKIESALIAIE